MRRSARAITTEMGSIMTNFHLRPTGTLYSVALSVCQSVILQTENESITISRNASLTRCCCCCCCCTHHGSCRFAYSASLNTLTSTSTLQQMLFICSQIDSAVRKLFAFDIWLFTWPAACFTNIDVCFSSPRLRSFMVFRLWFYDCRKIAAEYALDM